MKPGDDDFDTLWARLSMPASAVTQTFTASIRPPPPSVANAPPPRGATVELRGELARGGMGVVHAGYQVALRREVAVKVVRRSVASRDEQAAVREALAAGYLEHPNIVPVYTIDESDDGTPLIVMKRIQGVVWSDCIADPSLAPRMRDDPIAWHLDVFLAVCRAVQFAHEKGIVHRDVKPDNVLIGRHGDVYLVDWGLAVAIDPALRGRLPLAEDVRRMTGTPGYMAPEMLTAESDRLGPATDVYLLGATLHEVVTKSPRHTGDDLAAVLESTFLSEPHDYDLDVPEELAAICNRACRRDPAERFSTVADLASALRDFQRKRPALRFVQEGETLLERLKDQARASEGSDEDMVRIYETFGQCRSALDEAGRIWPDHPRGQVLRDEMLAVMAELEMERGNLDDAADLLERMSRYEEGLCLRLEVLQSEAARHDREYDQLKKLAQELDLNLAGRRKAALVAVFGLAVFVHNVAYGRLHAAGYEGGGDFLLGPLVMIPSLLLMRVLWRRGVFRNQASRQVLYLLLAVGLAIFGIRAIGAAHGIPPLQTHSYLAGVYAFAAAQLASLWDRRVYVSAAVLAIGAIATLLVPSFTFEVVGTSVLLATAVMAVLWWRQARPVVVQRGTISSPPGPPMSSPRA